MSQSTPVSIDRGSDSLVLNLERDGAGTIWYDFDLKTAISHSDQTALEDDLLLSQNFALSQADGFKVGEAYSVQLTLVNPTALKSVLLEYPFPSGFSVLPVDAIAPFQHSGIQNNVLRLYADELPSGVYSITFKVRSGFAVRSIYHRPNSIHCPILLFLLAPRGVASPFNSGCRFHFFCATLRRVSAIYDFK
ncbi:hypothetical protein IPJ72_01610 [Candidatus Peregrinibacteria bacterium]|nr:MAG: hypothetical protein IPJ72_01610 [Candidatus Peregrinibacteria bacterium]